MNTIAVLPAGLNRIYPADNASLASRIENRGALISEYLPDTGPESYRFIERDRIQAALSKALLVMDTGLSGGTLHTVRFAAEMGRPVYCPPGSSEGVRVLLETSARDLWRVLPAWKSYRKLCERLGEAPLAKPFDTPDTLLFELDRI